jgi:energy-converting hydrogenase A subunit M
MNVFFSLSRGTYFLHFGQRKSFIPTLPRKRSLNMFYSLDKQAEKAKPKTLDSAYCKDLTLRVIVFPVNRRVIESLMRV